MHKFHLRVNSVLTTCLAYFELFSFLFFIILNVLKDYDWIIYEEEIEQRLIFMFLNIHIKFKEKSNYTLHSLLCQVWKTQYKAANFKTGIKAVIITDTFVLWLFYYNHIYTEYAKVYN